MPEFLRTPFADAAQVNPIAVLLRLAVALLLGIVVTWIYTSTEKSSENGSSFPTTLTLMTVLIAMVTQVIGDNVARAFSLVGALSIVRFRTVVRDTRDTAFVIFSVVIGMAIGSHNLWVAVIGMIVVGSAAFLLARRQKIPGSTDPPYLVTIRAGLGVNLDPVANKILDAHLTERKLLSVSTAKQGTSLEYIYQAGLRGAADEMVRALNRIDGVQDIRVQQEGFEQE